MQTKRYDKTELARWDPWNGRKEPDAPTSTNPEVAHARAKSRLWRCRVALANARLALDHEHEDARTEELRSRFEIARLLFLGAERTVADLERLLPYPPAAG